MTTEDQTPPPAVLSTAQLVRRLDMYAELLAEAGRLIEAIPIDVFDAIKGRYPLCDELGGAAAMAKDDAAALRSNAEITGLSG
jgi:hypothetical protein